MNKTLKKFLESKGFKKHPDEKDKFIYEFAINSGLIVAPYESDDDEEKYEVTMNYLSNGAGNPELIFSALTEQDLYERYDVIYQLSYNIFDFFKTRNF
jgi:hypothetical protein